MRFAMFLSGLGTSQTSSGKRPAKQALRRAARQALCEDLEQRQFLSSYTVPSGVTQVYLAPDGLNPSTYVDVRLGSPTATVAAQLDGSTSTNTDTITASASGVTLNVSVPAVYQPTGGISFQSGPDGAAVIQGGDNDMYISVPSTSSTGSTIKLEDDTDSATVNDTIGGDVTSLTIQTNSLSAESFTTYPTVYVPELVSTVALTVNTEGGTYDAVSIGGYEGGVPTATVVTGAGNDSVVLGSDDDGDSPGTATVDFGAGTGTGEGTGLGNRLEVQSGRTAILAQAPGSASHTVVVDSVVLDNSSTVASLVVSDPSTIESLSVGSGDAAHINADSTIDSMEIDGGGVAYVDSPSTLGTVTLDTYGTLYVDASSTVSTLSVGEYAVANIDSGNSTFDTVTVQSYGDLYVYSSSTISTLTVDTSGAAYIDSGASTLDTVTVDGTLYVNSGSAISTLTVDAGGVAYINSGSTIGTMDVQSGGLCDIAAASPITTLTVEGNVNYTESGSWLDNPSVLDTNTIGSLTISGGVVNIGTQELLVTDTTPSTVAGYVVSAYYDSSSNDWLGSGITSSDAINNVGTDAVGYAYGTTADNSTTGFGLSSGEVLLRTTIAGDATMDGTANFTDFLSFQRNDGNAGDWTQGDFNYDGVVNFGDYLVFSRNDGSTYTP